MTYNTGLKLVKKSDFVVIIKVNPIQIGTFQGTLKLRVGRRVQKRYVGVTEKKIRKRV